MVALICGSIAGLILLIYGAFLVFFKEVITNKDIILFLFIGFAYVGYNFSYMFQIHSKDKLTK